MVNLHADPFSKALELVFPRACVLCGRYLWEDSGRKYPVCGYCENGLTLSEGPRCSVCGKQLISERGICMRCRDRIFDFDSAYPLWSYTGEIKKLIIEYKMHNRRSLSHFFAENLRMVWGERYPGVCLIPVPFRREKIRKVGWDQVDVLAGILARRGVPVTRCLERLTGISQKTLDYTARLFNLSGKIRLKAGSIVPRRAVLLDDVLTTGATLSECARVLKSGGAERVDALVLAAD